MQSTFSDQETIVLVMKAAYWIHLMESIYACYICRRCKINTIHTM